MTRPRTKTRAQPNVTTLALGVLAVALLSTGARAQEGDEDEPRRVLRDQSRMSVRLTSLREKMLRLSDRYETEGRSHNAQLLRDALSRFEEDGLLDQARDIEQSLSRSMLDTVDKQDGLTTSLESIYAVLRDRRDVDDIRSQVDMANQAIAELGNMIVDQQRLLSQTRSATDTPSELLQAAMETAETLESALDAAAGATAQAEAAEAGLAEVALAEQLAAAQRALEQSPGATSAQQRVVGEGVQQLLERLSQSLDDAGSPEALEQVEELRAEARQAAARASQAIERAASALERSERAESGASGDRSSAEAGDQATPSGAESGGQGVESARTGDSATGQGAGEQTDASGQPAGEPQASDGEQGSDSAASESQGSGSQGSQGPSGAQGQQGEPGEQGDAGPEGEPSFDGGDPSSAGESGEDAQPPEPEATPDEAWEQMARAAEDLEQARDSLREAERRLGAARNRAMAAARLGARDARDEGTELDDLTQRLETLEPDEGPELLDRTQELIDELSKLNDSLESGDTAGAQSAMAQARQDLNDLLRQLQQRGEGAGEQGGEQGGEQATDPEQLAQQAAEQERLERQLRELMSRLEEMPDQGFQPPAERAADAMNQAQRNMDSGDQQEAGTRQEEAVEQLEEAKQQLEGERDRYERLRQDEVLYRLKEELTTLAETQQAVGVEIQEIDGLITDSGRLSRSQRRALARLASEERELARRTEELITALEEDDAVAFVFALDQTRDDMESVADRVTDQQTGPVVMAMIDGIDQRIQDLLEVLAAEEERRRQAMDEQQQGEPQDQPPQDGKPPLVPAVAELLLIQKLELGTLSRLQTFEKLHPELRDEGILGPMERRLLERWALEHSRITEVFESMIPEQQMPPGMGVDDPHHPDAGGDDTGADDTGADDTGEPATDGEDGMEDGR